MYAINKDIKLLKKITVLNFTCFFMDGEYSIVLLLTKGNLIILALYK